MALNQKYTWHDFLKQHPEHKEKGTKRTSAEGKKAFESAYKAHVKNYLAERGEKVESMIKKVSEKRTKLSEKVKVANKTKKKTKINLAVKKLGKTDAAIARLGKFKEKNKTAQKTFK